MALDSLIATRILFRGCAEGWFTTHKLGQYFNAEKDDPVNARQIINGNDQDELIAGYHDQFLEALTAADDATSPPPVGETYTTTITVTSSAPMTVSGA